jgi:hypothetical protein
MSPRRQHMLTALHRSGPGERTPAASVRDVRLFAPFSPTSPDRLSAPELQHSFLHRKNVDGLTPAAMRLCSSGSRFCSPHVLTRAGHTRSLLRAHPPPRLPAGRRVEAVRRLLASATPWHPHVSGTTVSRLGLRLHAALSLPVSAIEGQRLQVPIPRGTGAKDRSVPLPAAPRTLLRASWKTPRHPP